MINRRKNTDRRIYTQEEKQWLLNKSKSKCAHCGKKLSMETMTVEHVVPFSKGGANALENHVALCEECNTLKADTIMNPEDWYPYLNKKYLKEITEYFQNYCSTVNHLYINNMYTSDILNIPTFFPMQKGKTAIRVCKDVQIKKAVYSDLDDIYKFFNNYYAIYDPEILPDVKNRLTHAYEKYCLMYYKNGKGDILAVFILSFGIEPYAVDSVTSVGLPIIICDVYLHPDLQIADWKESERPAIRVTKGIQNYFIFSQMVKVLPYKFIYDLQIPKSISLFEFKFKSYNTPAVNLLSDNKEAIFSEDEETCQLNLITYTEDIAKEVDAISKTLKNDAACATDELILHPVLREYTSNFSKVIVERFSSSKEIRELNKVLQEFAVENDKTFMYIHSYLPIS